jgi:aminoglycoside phosphotransferase (APT) family kinase protein
MMDDESLHERWAEVGDISVDVQAIERLIEEPISAIVPIPGGSINRVARIDLEHGNPLILRVGPSMEESDSLPSWVTHSKLEDEQRTLRWLSKVKPVAKLLPSTIHFEWAESADVGDMVIQTFVPGQPAAAVLPTMTGDQRLDFFRQLGETTRTIHSIAGGPFGPSWNNERFESWPGLVLSDCQGFLQDAFDMNLNEEPFDDLMDVVQDNRDELDLVRGALIHSDLSMHHVFVEPKAKRWKISGLIDFEFARIADPVSEGLVLDMLQRSDADAKAFFDGYGWDLETTDVRIEVARRLQAAWDITDKARLRKSP